jgi:hypothetical protein
MAESSQLDGGRMKAKMIVSRFVPSDFLGSNARTDWRFERTGLARKCSELPFADGCHEHFQGSQSRSKRQRRLNSSQRRRAAVES